MVKVMHFIQRNRGMTHDECVKYHRKVHAPLAVSTFGPKLKRYVAYYLQEAPDMPYDMLVEQWFEDEDWNRMQEFREAPEYLRLREDSDKLVNREKTVRVIFEENVIV